MNTYSYGYDYRWTPPYSHGRCPSCGRCNHCGQGGWQPMPYYWQHLQQPYAGWQTGVGGTATGNPIPMGGQFSCTGIGASNQTALT